MSIWNKILVGLICLAAPFYFYLAARLLKTSENWSAAVDKYEARLEQLAQKEKELIDGVEEPDGTIKPGLRQLRIELHKLMVDRRRMWLNCVPSIKTDPDSHTAEVSVTINDPDPHGITEKTVLYAFADADMKEKGRYLGEFTAAKVEGKRVVLAPTQRFSKRELGKLDAAAKAKHPWILYELMPQDNREIFASLSDEQKRSLLPASSVQQYLKDGKPAAEDDPKNRVVDGKYMRPLIDYGVLFNAENEKQTFLRDSIEAATRDRKLAEEALTLGREQEEACKKDIAATRKDREEMFRQRDIVAAHLKNLQEKAAALQAAVEGFIERNRVMAGQIAKFQLEAVRRIDRRTRAMARSDSGRP
ncbi:MAG: hypothetical protein JW959_03700 [Pirellulales bacterium]|nr:hypothetical protein [Pirellulales bacterium]